MDYSPVLAIVTGTLEIAAALYFIIRIKNKNSASVILISILFLLAGYQIFEALNCSDALYGKLTRAAYIDITWLPALGMLYIALAQKKLMLRIVSFIYLAAALLFSIRYFIDPESVMLSHCENVIAVYFHPGAMNMLYSIYYQSAILLMAVIPSLIGRGIIEACRRKDLRDFQLGIIIFMLPSLITAVVFEALSHALPSVMCHFALLLAIFVIRILYREAQGLSSNL